MLTMWPIKYGWNCWANLYYLRDFLSFNGAILFYNALVKNLGRLLKPNPSPTQIIQRICKCCSSNCSEKPFWVHFKMQILNVLNTHHGCIMRTGLKHGPHSLEFSSFRAWFCVVQPTAPALCFWAMPHLRIPARSIDFPLWWCHEDKSYFSTLWERFTGIKPQ